VKSTFDRTTREELIRRIDSLSEDSSARWGKMNVYQMVKHCRLWEEMALGKKKYRQVFMGRLFGKMALKGLLKDERLLMRNAATIPDLRITENGELAPERTRWISLIEEYAHCAELEIMHPFFGKMTKEQIGYLSYKHTDHHLRQFNS
jgi:hypothetical protein